MLLYVGVRSARSVPLAAAPRRWATNLGSTCSRNGRDSAGKRLGIKLGNGATARPNAIIARQRGLIWRPGRNVAIGRDFTLHAAVRGSVAFVRDAVTSDTWVNVIPKKADPLPNALPGGFRLVNVARFMSAPCAK